MTRSNALIALRALIRKDLVLYFSNRRALVMSIAAPIVIAAFFGSLFGSGSDKPTKVPIALVDNDASSPSRRRSKRRARARCARPSCCRQASARRRHAP